MARKDKQQTEKDIKHTDMQMLADLAQVSRSTVSRALSDSPLVNEKTKARIRALAEEHNYVVNEAARNLRLQKSNIVSVVLMLDIQSEQHISDPFFLEMIGHLADNLASAGYDLLLVHKPIVSASEFIAERAYRQSAGIIVIGQAQAHKELNKLAEGKVPIVVWGTKLPAKKYRLVGSENFDGGYLAASYLIEQGRRRIAFFGDIELPELKPRYDGYVRAHDSAGLEVDDHLVLCVPFDTGHAEQVIGEFLDLNPRIDAIVCCSDLIAMTAMALLNARGLRVPQDVALVGYDDISIAARANPALTTISQNIRNGGRVLVNTLLQLMEGRAARDHIMKVELVKRGSTP